MRDEGLITSNNALGFVKMLEDWQLEPCSSSTISKRMKQLPDNGISNYKTWSTIKWAHESYVACISIKKILFDGLNSLYSTSLGIFKKTVFP